MKEKEGKEEAEARNISVTYSGSTLEPKRSGGEEGLVGDAGIFQREQQSLYLEEKIANEVRE